MNVFSCKINSNAHLTCTCFLGGKSFKIRDRFLGRHNLLWESGSSSNRFTRTSVDLCRLLVLVDLILWRFDVEGPSNNRRLTTWPLPFQEINRTFLTNNLIIDLYQQKKHETVDLLKSQRLPHSWSWIITSVKVKFNIVHLLSLISSYSLRIEQLLEKKNFERKFFDFYFTCIQIYIHSSSLLSVATTLFVLYWKIDNASIRREHKSGLFNEYFIMFTVISNKMKMT